MPDLKPPKGFRHGLSVQEARERAEAALGSPQGQEALRQGWGRGFYLFVMDWGAVPSKPATIEKLKRDANEMKWDLMEMRDKQPQDGLSRALLRFYEGADALEDELREKYLKSEKS